MRTRSEVIFQTLPCEGWRFEELVRILILFGHVLLYGYEFVVAVCGYMCTTLEKFRDIIFLSEGGYKTQVICMRVIESVRSLPASSELGCSYRGSSMVWYVFSSSSLLSFGLYVSDLFFLI